MTDNNIKFKQIISVIIECHFKFYVSHSERNELLQNNREPDERNVILKRKSVYVISVMICKGNDRYLSLKQIKSPHPFS